METNILPKPIKISLANIFWAGLLTELKRINEGNPTALKIISDMEKEKNRVYLYPQTYMIDPTNPPKLKVVK